MSTPPRSVAVVGAGMLGLSTAWFLQERGVEVTVYDAVGPGAGASWGNAGWITPTLSTPLPEPSMLAYGIRQLLRPTSPLYVPPTADPGLIGFLGRLARNSTASRWRAGVRKLLQINAEALDAYDALAAGGVDGPIREAEPFVFGYTSPEQVRGMFAEGEKLAALGQKVDLEPLSADTARALAPILSDRVRGALLLHGQRYLDPPAYVAALAASVRTRGARTHYGVAVAEVVDRHSGTGRVRVLATDVEEVHDAAVLATGVDLPRLAAPFGVRVRMRAGRGYSFSVVPESAPAGPVYFPGCSVVCTPLEGRMRIAGMMEFRAPDAPLDPRRVRAIVDSVRPLLRGVDLDDRAEEWVGSRPCTVDGLPLVGATASPRIFVAGGHAMEGMTLGPATGRLLAEAICTGTTPSAIAGFDPLRR